MIRSPSIYNDDQKTYPMEHEEVVRHIEGSCKAYWKQYYANRICLREAPKMASSWQIQCVRDLEYCQVSTRYQDRCASGTLSVAMLRNMVLSGERDIMVDEFKDSYRSSDCRVRK